MVVASTKRAHGVALRLAAHIQHNGPHHNRVIWITCTLMDCGLGINVTIDRPRTLVHDPFEEWCTH
jgi:hypothetical protein